MPQQPFSPQGLQSKLAELYALPDTALVAQANQVRADTSAWVKSNFALNQVQDTYLNGIDPRFMKHLGCEAGLAIENRLNIILDAPFPAPPPSISKMVMTQTTMKPRFSLVEGFRVEGDLTIIITY